MNDTDTFSQHYVQNIYHYSGTLRYITGILTFSYSILESMAQEQINFKWSRIDNGMLDSVIAVLFEDKMEYSKAILLDFGKYLDESVSWSYF